VNIRIDNLLTSQMDMSGQIQQLTQSLGLLADMFRSQMQQPLQQGNQQQQSASQLERNLPDRILSDSTTGQVSTRRPRRDRSDSRDYSQRSTSRDQREGAVSLTMQQLATLLGGTASSVRTAQRSPRLGNSSPPGLGTSHAAVARRRRRERLAQEGGGQVPSAVSSNGNHTSQQRLETPASA